jgi:hypothetical protein
MRSIVSLGCAALLSGLIVVPAHATLITNGSFEAPVLVASPFFTFYPNGSTAIPGWTVDTRGTATDIQLSRNAAFAGLNASDGSQFLDLTGNVGRGAGLVSNAVATSSDFDYVVSFDVGAINFGGSFGVATVDLLINGDLVGSYSATPAAFTSMNWVRYSYGFAGTGMPVSIGLYSSSSLQSSNLGVGLDNVVLEASLRNTPAVPEPMSWVMMTAGFGMVGAALRRRQASGSGRVAAA